MKKFSPPTILAALALMFFGPAAHAQSTITLDIDASDVARNRIHVFEKMSVHPGKFSFFYPKWIQGEHRPSGPMNNMVNLRVTAGGKAIPWQRDDAEPFAFWCTAPRGVTTLNISFDDVTDWNTTSTAHLARIKWNRLFVYQRGMPHSRITVNASLKMPAGWQYATALPIESQEGGGIVRFKPVDLERLSDSPVVIGQYFRKIPLTATGDLHEMDIAADSPKALEAKPETIAAWKSLIEQAHKMFGAHHYRGYRFLVTLSDWGGGEGLEHHESSEDGRGLNALSDPQLLDSLSGLLGHEYAHSWNGKYRRPAGLTTSDFEKPLKGELLWIYEGLTQYLGYVLTVRSGMWTEQTFRDQLADSAALMANQGGRSWRPVVDTARAIEFTRGSSAIWESSRRYTDYYQEGALVWLEADTIIRQRSGGQRSLDEYLKRFYGQGKDTGPMIKPYTLAEVCAALGQVEPYDWASFFKKRIYDIHEDAAFDGLGNGGWRVEYNAEPNPFVAALEKQTGWRVMKSGIGFNIDANSVITDVKPGTAAFRAGLVPNVMLLDNDNKPLAHDKLVALITAAANSAEPIALTGDIAGVTMKFSVDYHGGIRYPHLVREAGKPDLLAEIAKAK